MNISFKKYSPEYKEQVIELLKDFWPDNKSDRLAYFKWKYEDNPYTESPLCFLALDNNRVVGFRGFFVVPVKNNSECFLCALASDSKTDPNYRGLGIFKSLLKYSIESLKNHNDLLVYMNSSSGGPTAGTHLALGCTAFSEREHLFRFSFYGIIKKVIGRRTDWKNRKLLIDGKTIFLTDSFIAEEFESIPYDYNLLSHPKTKEFYEWRLQNPLNNFKYACMYDADNKLRAFIIFADMGGNRFDIVDFNYYNEKDLKALFDIFFKSIKPFFVLLWTVGKNCCMFTDNKTYGLHSFSFILSHLKKFQKPPFMMRPLMQQDTDRLTSPKNWDLYKLIGDEI